MNCCGATYQIRKEIFLGLLLFHLCFAKLVNWSCNIRKFKTIFHANSPFKGFKLIFYNVQLFYIRKGYKAIVKITSQLGIPFKECRVFTIEKLWELKESEQENQQEKIQAGDLFLKTKKNSNLILLEMHFVIQHL